MKLYNIVFSPTGGTQKVSALLTNTLKGEVTPIDLTDSKQDFRAVQLTSDDVAVIAVPSYGGRVPAVAIDRLGSITGHGARAILVCVYGNRAYEDTLVELEDAAKQAGFQVIAAVAAIAEHSIARQFAADRPDTQDAQQLSAFAKQIQDKLSSGNTAEPSILVELVWSQSRQRNVQNAVYASMNALSRQLTQKTRKRWMKRYVSLVCDTSVYARMLPAE